MTDFKSIMTALPGLSPDQLEELKKRVTALLNFHGRHGVQDKPSVDDDWLLFGIIEHLNASGLGATIPPFGVIKKLQLFASFNKKSILIREFFEKEIPGITKTEKRALGIVVARALARNISSWSEVSLQTMMRFVGKVPEAVDEAYPGYLQSGCIRVLIKKRRKNLD